MEDRIVYIQIDPSLMKNLGLIEKVYVFTFFQELLFQEETFLT
jgi:hypothetical protein